MKIETYRSWLYVLAIWCLLCLPCLSRWPPIYNGMWDRTESWVTPLLVGGIVGFYVIPLAIIGLWSEKAWGVVAANLGTTLVIGSSILEGVSEVLMLCLIHLTVLVVVAVRWFSKDADLLTPPAVGRPCLWRRVRFYVLTPCFLPVYFLLIPPVDLVATKLGIWDYLLLLFLPGDLIWDTPLCNVWDSYTSFWKKYLP
jgi:hypothetical protein